MFTSILSFFVFLISTASANMVDMAVAFHMDGANGTVGTVNSFLQPIQSNLKLSNGTEGARLALIAGTSDGRTSLVVPLYRGTSWSAFTNLGSLQSFLSFPQQHTFQTDIDPIFERLQYSVFTETADRKVAPNFIVVFVEKPGLQRDEAKNIVKLALGKGADVAVAGNAGQYAYGDWKDPVGIKVNLTFANVSNTTAASMIEAFSQCKYRIQKKPCRPVIPKRCRCVRRIEIVVTKSTNKKYCPVTQDEVPCEDKECPPIDMEYGPMQKWLVVIIIWAVLLVLPWVCWPICCCGVYCLISRYMGVLMEWALEQGGDMIQEGLDDQDEESA